jgi:excisionase family DNA binding protein
MPRDLDTPIYQPQEPESLLTEEQLARFLNVKPRTITQWIQENRIPYYRFGWKLVRIRLSDVESLLNRSLVPARKVPIAVRSRRNEKPTEVPQN